MSIIVRRRRWALALVAVAVVGAAAYAAVAATGHGRGSTARPGSSAVVPAVPVVAAPARASDVPVYLAGLGSVTPLNTVAVHTRVDGQLMRVNFQEGQLVHSSDLLAEIDSRPFEVQLAQATCACASTRIRPAA